MRDEGPRSTHEMAVHARELPERPRKKPSRRAIWARLGVEAGLAVVLVSFLFLGLSGVHWRAELVSHITVIPGSQSIAVDSRGVVHLGWGAYLGGLYHSTNAGGDWTSTKVSDDMTYFTSTVVDLEGAVHIAFVNQSLKGVTELKYARGEGDTWRLNDIGSGTPGIPCSLAVDRNGSAHVVYERNETTHVGGVEQATSSLMYATNSEGSWHIEEIDNITGYFYPPSWLGVIALDSGGIAHVVVDRYPSMVLYYERTPAGPWTVEDLSSELVLIGDGVSMAIAPDDSVHLGYFGILQAEGFIHASRAPGQVSWVLERVVNATSSGECRVAAGPGNQLWMAYVGSSGSGRVEDQFQLGLASSLDGSTWKNEAIIRMPVDYDFGFAVDSGGKAWIETSGLSIQTNRMSLGQKASSLSPMPQLMIAASGVAVALAAANAWRLRTST